MKMKTIFLVLFACIFNTSTHAMLIKKTNTLHTNKYTRTYTLDNQQNGIHNYLQERDEQNIRPIVYKHADKLTSDVTEKNRTELTDNYIMSTLNKGHGTISKVYLSDGKAVGFINYYLKKPDSCDEYFKKNVPGFGFDAHINFLAVNDEYQRKAIGKALMEDTINDLKNKSVNSTTLYTTGMACSSSSLGKFYGKFGFIECGGSKYTGVTKYTNHLNGDSNTIFMCRALCKAIRDWVHKPKE